MSKPDYIRCRVYIVRRDGSVPPRSRGYQAPRGSAPAPAKSAVSRVRTVDDVVRELQEANRYYGRR